MKQKAFRVTEEQEYLLNQRLLMDGLTLQDVLSTMTQWYIEGKIVIQKQTTYSVKKSDRPALESSFKPEPIPYPDVPERPLQSISYEEDEPAESSPGSWLDNL